MGSLTRRAQTFIQARRKAPKALLAVGLGLCMLRIPGASRSRVCIDPSFVRLGSPTTQRPVRYPLRVKTLNLAEETETEKVLSLFAPATSRPAVDIWLLQEAVHVPEGDDDVLTAIANELGMHVVFTSAAEVRLDGSLEGLAIASRYPLADVEAIPLQRFGLHTRSRCRVALAATVDLGGSAIRIVNVHLDTRINVDKRLEQLSPVFDEVARIPGPAIVGGDLNTTNIFWLEHLLPIPFVQYQAEKVFERFHQLGFHSPQPLDGPITLPIALQRLDWLFVRDLEVGSWGVEPVGFSDHRAVWLTIQGG